MLTPWKRLAAIVVAGVMTATAAAGPARADGGRQVCTDDGTVCWIESETGGSDGEVDSGTGDGGGGSGRAPCYYDGMRMPCTQDGWGYFSDTDGCYYIVESPQPPADHEAWEGHEPGDGAVYRQRCFGDFIGFLVWRATPPQGQPGTITPEQLAARAIRAIPMAKPVAGMAPRQGGAGLVGLPVWLWISNTPAAWGPVERTAAVPGLSVTARAQVSAAVWNMGDGEKVTCTGPGAPYKKEYGLQESECGYRYTKAGRYPVSVTTTWRIEWWVDGGTGGGDATVTRQSATGNITIEELQVVRS